MKSQNQVLWIAISHQQDLWFTLVSYISTILKQIAYPSRVQIFQDVSSEITFASPIWKILKMNLWSSLG